MQRERHHLLLILLTATLAIYAVGVSDSFIFDDYPNIVYNDNLTQASELDWRALWQGSLSSDAGRLGRPVAMFSFWVNQHFSGLDARAFKLNNIFIHLLAGVALYWLCLLLLRGYTYARTGAEPPSHRTKLIALTAVALWLLHPLNLTGVLYVVQRMTSLAALFTLLGAVSYAEARLRLMRGEPGYGRLFSGFVLFGVLAAFSKESGVLLPLYLFAIEAVLFRFATAKAADRRVLQYFYVVVLVLPGLTALGLLLATPESFLEGYQQRPFSLAERLLTQCRVLWLYLGWALWPDPSLLGLYHDDVVVSRSLFDPWTTLPAVAGIATLLVTAMLGQRRLPMLSFGLAWFFFGHTLESTVFPLELIYEHRNYTPLMGLALAAACSLHSLPVRFPRQTGLIASLVWTLSLASLTGIRAWQWADPIRHRHSEVEHHPDSARANFELAVNLARPRSRPDSAAAADQAEYRRLKAYLERAVELNPNAPSGYHGLIYVAVKFRQPIEQRWLDGLAERLKRRANDPTRTLLGLVELHITVDSKILTTQQVVTLFEAALDNPRTTDPTKAVLLAILARYFALAAKDYQKAVTLSIAATEYNPQSAALRIGLTELAIALNNIPYAREQIAKIRALDRVGRYDYKLSLLEAAVEKAQ